VPPRILFTAFNASREFIVIDSGKESSVDNLLFSPPLPSPSLPLLLLLVLSLEAFTLFSSFSQSVASGDEEEVEELVKKNKRVRKDEEWERGRERER
jgi:hypothetical protein